MSSTGTATPHIHLNQWQSSDKPERLDFNADNQKIDQAIANRANLNLLPNQNLLDNWYFSDPVNQRGSLSYSAQGYTIDRWYLVNGSASLTNNGITLQKSSDKTYVEFHNRIERCELSSIYTLTAIVDGELKSASGKISDIQHALIARGWGGDALNRIEAYIHSALNIVFVRFIFISETPHLVQAAKLELGDHQTLAHQDASGKWVLNDPPPHKALELMKCQRYQLALSRYTRYRMADYNSNELRFLVPTPTTLRAAPTIIRPENLRVRQLTGLQVEGFTFTVTVHSSEGVVIAATKTEHGLTDGQLVPIETTPVLLDANL
ncbi:MAG: hypothetical protein HFG26_13425 [Provencibacterium sp.]|nr:hypothetical protein [Provencibacterium sp.]